MTDMTDREEVITEDEAALYDRQIRLWGLDAQKRLRAARCLLIGLSGLGAEVAKNIVLSGVKSLTLLDPHQVTEEDFCSQFLVNRSDIGKNRAESSLLRTQQLNPMVEVSADSSGIKEKGEDFLCQFDVICATCCTREELLRLDDICRRHNILFYCGDVWGYFGYMFADLKEHEFAEEVKQTKRKHEDSWPGEGGGSGEPGAPTGKSHQPETRTVRKNTSFVTLEAALSKDWANKTVKRTPNTYFIMQVLLRFRGQHGRDPCSQHLKEDQTELLELRDQVLAELHVTNPTLVPNSFASHCFAELSPVCAVVGGVLGQEIIKAVSKKDAPHNNFFFFNGLEGSGMVDCIGS